MNNKIVVHFATGKIMKGETSDFFPNKQFFHLCEQSGGDLLQVDVQSLKAGFFVESFEGNSSSREDFSVERKGFGKKIRVQYKDGEVQYGYTQGYTPDRPGFFVTPCDPNSNNQRIFIVTNSTALVKFV